MKDRTIIAILCILLVYTWISQHPPLEYVKMVKEWSPSQECIQQETSLLQADYIFKEGEYHWFNGEKYVPLDPEPYREEDLIESLESPNETLSLHVPNPDSPLTILDSDELFWTSNDITIDSSHALIVGDEIDGPYVEINYDSIVYRTADGQEGQILFKELGKGSNKVMNGDLEPAAND